MRMLFALALVPMAAASSARAQVKPDAKSSAERTADSLFAGRDYRKAFTAYQQLASAHPLTAAYWSQMGMAAAFLARYAEGARAFGRAADITKGPTSSYNAGAMHARLGNVDSAYYWLGRAVAAGFSDEKTLRSDDDLATLRGTARFDSLVYSATHAPTPCATGDERRRFDFWIGEWDVTAVNGQPTGTSVVQSVSGGCGLLENWVSVRGGAGKSLNTFNPAVGQWQQYWIGQDGNTIEYRESAWNSGSVTFIARFDATEKSPALAYRLTFTPRNDGTVRQHGEVSPDSGKTWNTTYDFIYHRRK